MKPVAAILALAGTCAALDIYLRSDKVCQGNAEVCVGINPNTCCGKHFPALPRPGNGPKWWGSVGFRENIWTIDARAHGFDTNSWSCGGVSEGRRESAKYFCLGGVPGDRAYYGGGYGIVGKRDVQEGPQKCQEPVKAIIRDGEGWHEYNLTAITDLKRRAEISELVSRNVHAADVPEHFHEFRM